ncbi:WXG100 family type VII secretion target [Streptomyces sp. NPDC059862]|uniref:WXG100 family type VII secretion target n=1 Tax=unclassified Streptomyces TaxID=2593676 RepID=UPI00363FB768
MTTPTGGGMFDADIYMDPNGTQVTAEEMQRVSRNIEDIITNLQSEIATYTMWQGAAREAYDAVQATWNNHVIEMKQIFEGHTGLLLDLRDGWQAVDRRGTGMWDGLR